MWVKWESNERVIWKKCEINGKRDEKKVRKKSDTNEKVIRKKWEKIRKNGGRYGHDKNKIMSIKIIQ